MMPRIRPYPLLLRLVSAALVLALALPSPRLPAAFWRPSGRPPAPLTLGPMTSLFLPRVGAGLPWAAKQGEVHGSPAYAMRSVNAGQKESPVHRALTAGLEQAARQQEAITASSADWVAAQDTLIYQREVAYCQPLVLRTRSNAAPEPAELQALIQAVEQYHRGILGIRDDHSDDRRAELILHEQLVLWQSVLRLPPVLRDGLVTAAGGSEFTPRGMIRLIFFGLPALLAQYGFVVIPESVLVGPNQRALVPFVDVYPVERLESTRPITVWGRTIRHDRVIVGDPRLKVVNTPESITALYQRYAVHRPGTAKQIETTIDSWLSPSPEKLQSMKADSTPEAVVRRLVAGENPWKIAVTIIQWRGVQAAQGYSREQWRQVIIQDPMEAHEAWHLEEQRSLEMLELFRQLPPASSGRQGLASQPLMSQREQRAQRAALRVAEPPYLLLAMLGSAANPAGGRYQDGYTTELNRWVVELAKDPARYGFGIIPSTDPRASAENQIRAQLGQLAAPHYEPLVRALVATPEGPAAVLPAVTVPTTWGEKLLWPSVIVGGVAVALSIYGVRWRQQRTAWNEFTRRFNGQLTSLMTKELGQTLFQALALDDWHSTRVTELVLNARHAALQALIDRLMEDARTKRSRDLGTQRATVTSLRRLLKEAGHDATHAALSMKLVAIEKAYPPPAAPPKGGLEEPGATPAGLMTRRGFLRGVGAAGALTMAPALLVEPPSTQDVERAASPEIPDGVLDRLYRAQWERPQMPPWRAADPTVPPRVTALLDYWRRQDQRWMTLTAALQEHPTDAATRTDLKALHRALLDYGRQWLRDEGVSVGEGDSQAAFDTLFLETLVDHLGSLGYVCVMNAVQVQPVPASGDSPAVRLVYYPLPELFRIVEARPDGVVAIAPLDPALAATTLPLDFVAYGTAFVLEPTIARILAADQRDRRSAGEMIAGVQPQSFWDYGPWMLQSAIEGWQRRPDDPRPAMELAMAKLMGQPSWVMTAGRSVMTDEREEAMRAAGDHARGHVADHRSPDPAVWQMMRQAARVAVRPGPDRQQDLMLSRQVERRGLIRGFRAAPRRFLSTLLYNLQQLVALAPGSPNRREVMDRTAGEREVYEAILAELLRHPGQYGVVLQKHSPIPLVYQAIGQLYELADPAHPERAEQLADALEQQFGMAPVVPATWVHRPTALMALAAAALLGVSSVWYLRARRARELAQSPTSGRNASGLEETAQAAAVIRQYELVPDLSPRATHIEVVRAFLERLRRGDEPGPIAPLPPGLLSVSTYRPGPFSRQEVEAGGIAESYFQEDILASAQKVMAAVAEQLDTTPEALGAPAMVEFWKALYWARDEGGRLLAADDDETTIYRWVYREIPRWLTPKLVPTVNQATLAAALKNPFARSNDAGNDAMQRAIAQLLESQSGEFTDDPAHLAANPHLLVPWLRLTLASNLVDFSRPSLLREIAEAGDLARYVLDRMHAPFVGALGGERFIPRFQQRLQRPNAVLAYVPDNNVELAASAKWAEVQLSANPTLSLSMIVKADNGAMNDGSLADVRRLLTVRDGVPDVYARLRAYEQGGRFRLVAGPAAHGFPLGRLPAVALAAVQQADVVFGEGEANTQTLNGLAKEELYLGLRLKWPDGVRYMFGLEPDPQRPPAFFRVDGTQGPYYQNPMNVPDAGPRRTIVDTVRAQGGLEETARAAAGKTAVILVKPVDVVAPRLAEWLTSTVIRTASGLEEAQVIAAQLQRQGITGIRVITPENFSVELDLALQAAGLEQSLRDRALEDLRALAFA